MDWVNPTTWSTGQTVTKGQFGDWNASIGSVGDHGGWSTWQPTLTGIDPVRAALFQPVTVRAGRKLKVGKIGYVSWNLQWSSTQTLTGTQYVRSFKPTPVALTLPWAAPTANLPAGSAYLYVANVDDTYLMAPYFFYTATLAFRYQYDGNSANLPYWQLRGAPTESTQVGHPIPASISGGSFASSVFAGHIVYRTNT